MIDRRKLVEYLRNEEKKRKDQERIEAGKRNYDVAQRYYHEACVYADVARIVGTPSMCRMLGIDIGDDGK